MRRASRLALAALIWGGSAASAATTLTSGTDVATLLVPAGVRVVDYANEGYRLKVEDGVAHVEVRLDGLGSRQGFTTPARARTGSVAFLARSVTAGAKTRYEAVSRLLGWVAANVRYDLDRGAPQDAATVLARRSGYCTGIARLAVGLLASVGIPAREVAGYIVEDQPGGARSGYHRWIEVLYEDRGWVFADPLASHHFVPATYLRLAADTVEGGEPGHALLLSHVDRLEDREVLATTPLFRVRVRSNLEDRRAWTAPGVGRGVGGSER